MPADIRFDDDNVVVEGTALFPGKLVATREEITTTGPVAGFSFSDRKGGGGFFNAGATRFVWYCENKQARLWSKSDLLFITGNGAGKCTMAVSGTVSAEVVIIDGLGNVADTLRTLQAQVAELKVVVTNLHADNNELRQKLGLGIKLGLPTQPRQPGGRPKPIGG